MGQYDVSGNFIAGRQLRAADDERNYIAQRRAIEDPRTDARAAEVDAARAENIKQYGVQAADPVSYGQLKGIAQRDELHPIEVQQATTTLEGSQADNTAKIDARGREAAVRTLDAIEASGATTPQEVAQRIPPAMLAQLGTDPAKFPQLLETLGQFPDLKTGIGALRDGLLGQEKVDSIQSGIDPATGKPVYYGVGERQKPGALAITPDDRMFDLERRQAEASIASANRANRPSGTASTAAAAKAADKAGAAARATALVDEAIALIEDGARNGYIPSNEQDLATRAGAVVATGLGQVPGIGGVVKGAQRTLDPKAQGVRDQVEGTTNAILREYVKALGITGGSINSNFELQNIQSIIDNAGAGAEARIRALQRVKELISNDSTAERILAAEGKGSRPTQTQNATGAVPADRKAALAAKYGFGD